MRPLKPIAVRILFFSTAMLIHSLEVEPSHLPLPDFQTELTKDTTMSILVSDECWHASLGKAVPQARPRVSWRVLRGLAFICPLLLSVRDGFNSEASCGRLPPPLS